MQHTIKFKSSVTASAADKRDVPEEVTAGVAWGSHCDS